AGGSSIRSLAWKWFEEIYIDNIRHGVCNIEMVDGQACDTKVKTGDSTTGLWRHLNIEHGYTKNSVQQPNRKQTTIKKAFEISSSKPHNTIEQAVRDKAITEVIVAQNLPLSFTEEKMFKRFTKIVDSRWIVPSREKIKNLIDEGFNQISSCLRHDLHKAETVSLTADLWTAYSRKGYLGITATWINKNFELNNAVLAVTFLRYPHTADAIVKCIEDVLEHWDLKNKVFSIT
ncbi:39449_t:CDS:2, partial [Gigaspora margarita]